MAEELQDPFCLPDSPVPVTCDEILLAHESLKGNVVYTNCAKSHMDELTGMEVYLKEEYKQHTGSFKERGARYAFSQLNSDEYKGIVVASAGNYASAACYHGKLLGIPITVVLPKSTPIVKIRQCLKYDATIIFEGDNFSQARQHALKIGQEQGLIYISGTDHPDVIRGNGTIALEILEQVPDVDAIIAACGGGGLIAGILTTIKAMKPSCEVIGVESEAVPGFSKALEAGRPITVEGKSTIAEGLAVPLVGNNTFAICKGKLDKMITISEECIASAILRLIELERCVIEGSGATPVGALLSGKLDHLKGKKVVCVLSGSNIDTTTLTRSLERALAVDGQLLKIDVTIIDLPGELAKLLVDLGNIGANIKHIKHERAWVFDDIFSVKVRLICETHGYDHALEIRNMLKQKKYRAEYDKFPSRPKGIAKQSKKSCTCPK